MYMQHGPTTCTHKSRSGHRVPELLQGIAWQGTLLPIHGKVAIHPAGHCRDGAHMYMQQLPCCGHEHAHKCSVLYGMQEGIFEACVMIDAGEDAWMHAARSTMYTCSIMLWPHMFSAPTAPLADEVWVIV